MTRRGRSSLSRVAGMFRCYDHRRKHCRAWLSTYAWLYFALLMAAPFIVYGDGKAEPTVGIFGMPPTVERWVFNGLFLLCGALIVRALGGVVTQLNNLHENDRELTRVLTQLTTAHGLNHGHVIDPPRLKGDGGAI